MPLPPGRSASNLDRGDVKRAKPCAAARRDRPTGNVYLRPGTSKLCYPSICRICAQCLFACCRHRQRLSLLLECLTRRRSCFQLVVAVSVTRFCNAHQKGRGRALWGISCSPFLLAIRYRKRGMDRIIFFFFF